MWKKNKSLQSVVERNTAAVSILPMGKPLLTVSRLYEFPTRTIETLPDEEERKKVQNVLSDEKHIEALIHTTALSHPPMITDRIKRFVLGKNHMSVSSVIVTMDTPNMCVICLEAFNIDEEVRELPCHHEYHCICIGEFFLFSFADLN
jgi:hypothetical protein